MKLEAELDNKANPTMMHLADLRAILFCLKLTRLPNPVLEVFTKILPMISKVTSKNFPQRNPILVVHGLRQDLKHEPMDDMMMGNPILVIFGLRSDPKHNQIDDTKSRSPMIVVIGSRCDPNQDIMDDMKHMNSMLVVIGSRRDPNQNPIDEITICLECFSILFCWV